MAGLEFWSPDLRKLPHGQQPKFLRRIPRRAGTSRSRNHPPRYRAPRNQAHGHWTDRPATHPALSDSGRPGTDVGRAVGALRSAPGQIPALRPGGRFAHCTPGHVRQPAHRGRRYRTRPPRPCGHRLRRRAVALPGSPPLRAYGVGRGRSAHPPPPRQPGHRASWPWLRRPLALSGQPRPCDPREALSHGQPSDRRCGEHLRIGEPVPRPHPPGNASRGTGPAPLRPPHGGYPRYPGSRHRRRRKQSPGLRGQRWPPRLLPTTVFRLWPRGRALQTVLHPGEEDHHGPAGHLPLPPLPGALIPGNCAKGPRRMTDIIGMTLVDQLSDFSRWRAESAAAVGRLRAWLNLSEVGDAQSDLRLQYVLDRLRNDKLVVAFVAEFSRGKSELINAIFFSSFGDRILPSSAGRTTMCPTELQWHTGASQEIRLLPIETRATQASVSELKRQPEQWVAQPLNGESATELQEALARVGETIRVSQEEAGNLGFEIDIHGREGLKPGTDGLVEIPRWRHALIQFQHPLLEQGLVVLDTPGLNAIGAEPELTLSLLPNAHAVLFVLGIDTGVTQSDLAVWREYVQSGSSRQKGRLVVLHTIDSLWDGLRDDTRIEAEIAGQVRSVAETLDASARHIFPVSAQKGLVGRITGDQALLERSRLPVLEQALSEDLLPTKREIVRDNTLGEAGDLIAQARGLLNARLSGVREQLGELTDLRGKNQSVITYMMRKIRSEKEEFEQGLQKYYAVRSVFTNLTNNLLAHLGLDALRDETRRTREAMMGAAFSRGLREAMEGFFVRIRANLKNSSEEVAEIVRRLEAMHKRFSVEHGLTLTSPTPFSTLRYEQEIDRLEKAFNSQINTALTLATTAKRTITHQFFETVALQARRTFEVANRDVEQWLRAVMSPLETQVREYQMQLKHRLDSVKRIHEATDTLESRVAELLEAETLQLRRLEELEIIATDLHELLGANERKQAALAA